MRSRELVDNLAAALAIDECMCRQDRCAWPRSLRGGRFERFRTSKQTGRNHPKATFASDSANQPRAAVAQSSNRYSRVRPKSSDHLVG